MRRMNFLIKFILFGQFMRSMNFLKIELISSGQLMLRMNFLIIRCIALVSLCFA